jgi:hypothetical protein
MRSSVVVAIALFAAAIAVGCSTSSSSAVTSPPGSDPAAVPPGGSSGAPGDDAGGPGDPDDPDASSGSDGAVAPGPPALANVGRNDASDPAGPVAAWPGVRAIVRFDGSEVSARLTQLDGYSGGPSWFDVIVDGVTTTKLSVAGASEDHELAAGLAPGVHVVELAKRTEPKYGAVRFEGFTFGGGGKLLAPPARPPHRIEFLTDSTIDGFGVEGDLATTCAGGAPAAFDDAQKSAAILVAEGTNAEPFLLGYSGKGLTRNEAPSDTETYDQLYGRTLPDVAASAWPFASWTPDAVVISLGGTDYDGGSTTPPGFTTAYGALVDTIRAHYPAAHVYLTIWSQIKDATRAAMKSALDGIVAARASDTKLHVFEFTEADPEVETGCYGHANPAHHAAAAAELAAKLEADLGW